MLGTILLIVLGVAAALVAIVTACIIHWSISTDGLNELYDRDE